MYCERLKSNFVKYLYNNSVDESALVAIRIFQTGLNEASCKKLTKHNQCLVTSFRARCEQSMGQAFLKVDRLLQHCLAFVKTAKNGAVVLNHSAVLILAVLLLTGFGRF